MYNLNHQKFGIVSKRQYTIDKKLYEGNNIYFKICGEIWGMRCVGNIQGNMTS